MCTRGMHMCTFCAQTWILPQLGLVVQPRPSGDLLNYKAIGSNYLSFVVTSMLVSTSPLDEAGTATPWNQHLNRKFAALTTLQWNLCNSVPAIEVFFPRNQEKTNKKGLCRKWKCFFPEIKWRPNKKKKVFTAIWDYIRPEFLHLFVLDGSW